MDRKAGSLGRVFPPSTRDSGAELGTHMSRVASQMLSNVLESPAGLRLGIDIGGAFTDLVAYDSVTGKTAWVKVETTSADFSEGVKTVLRRVTSG